MDTAERYNMRRLRQCKFQQESLMPKTCEVRWRTSWRVQLITASQTDV
jgi:hypothetical protein